ncbi:helix-turn-helix domain-containing protein [Christensenellaceae bacterium OttesenSCG-928-M15]|nr:helix-turn-helix domain-containing protein [Christensenellaceae bacterium OttesenSCG-928-M15]
MLSVLIADDEYEARDDMIACIDWENAGIEIIGTASDGPAALEMIVNQSPDIVLIDIKMPGMSGLEVIKKSHSSACYPSYIVISGYGDFCYTQQAIQLGVSSYLLKPFRPGDVLKAVHRSLDQIDVVRKLKCGNELFAFALGDGQLDGSIYESIEYPVEEENALVRSMYSDSPRLAEQALRSFFGRVLSRHTSFEAINNCCLMLYAQICRVLSEHGERLKNNHFAGVFQKEGEKISAMQFAMKAVVKEAQALLGGAHKTNLLIQQAIEYIDRHYHEALSLEVLAKQLYISTPYLSRLFTQHVRMGFVEYVHKVRVEHAKKQLLDPRNRIADVAEGIGYSDAKYFSQVFKRETGLTPQQYRKQGTT